jgi:hypothetical protein
VRIGIRLKIDNKLFCPISLPQKRDSVSDLFTDRFQTGGSPGAKGPIVTICATAFRHSSIPIGAAEPAVDADFINPAAERFFQETAERIVPFPQEWKLRMHGIRLKIMDKKLKIKDDGLRRDFMRCEV